jgi:hypothetical protein
MKKFIFKSWNVKFIVFKSLSFFIKLIFLLKDGTWYFGFFIKIVTLLININVLEVIIN